MANLGCILGCITVSSANNVIDVTEDPGGAPLTWATSITAGDYFPDSGTGAEDLAAVVATAMTARSRAVGKTWVYTGAVSSTTGQITLSTPGGSFQLDITGNSDSIFIEMGYGTTTPVAASSITSTTAPTGTWYPTTPDGGEELISDTRWGIHREGVSVKGCTGKRYTRQWGSSKVRTLVYGPVVGPNGFAYPNGDIDRAATCYENHWCKGKRVRVYTSSRTITGAVDHDEIFEGIVLNDDFEPRRYSGHNELDWWELTLEFGKYVS